MSSPSNGALAVWKTFSKEWRKDAKLLLPKLVFLAIIGSFAWNTNEINTVCLVPTAMEMKVTFHHKVKEHWIKNSEKSTHTKRFQLYEEVRLDMPTSLENIDLLEATSTSAIIVLAITFIYTISTIGIDIVSTCINLCVNPDQDRQICFKTSIPIHCRYFLGTKVLKAVLCFWFMVATFVLTGFLHGLSHINQMTTDCTDWIWYHKWLFCAFTILCTFIALLVLISHSSDSNDLIRVKIQAFKRERQVAKLEGGRGETIPIPNCVVCTEPIQSTQPIALDPCGHTNCCWRCALTIENSDRKCPTCRKRFDKIMPLYAKLEERRGERDYLGQQECVVCTEPIQTSVTLDPCGHTNCCLTCAFTIANNDRKCPTCRTIFVKAMPIFR